MQEAGTIFLVDDDAAVCHALTLILEAHGYQVRTFPSAEDFLALSESTADGVMLLDMRLTGISGLELLAELARRGIDLPLIFITGHGNSEMTRRALESGALALLEKPFSNEVLLENIRIAFSYTAHSRQ